LIETFRIGGIFGAVDSDGAGAFVIRERLSDHRVAATDPNIIINARAASSHGGIEIDFDRKSKDIG